MALENMKQILERTAGTNAFKLLLLTGQSSRPGLEPLWGLLLRPFVHNGEFPIRYKQGDRDLVACIRTADKNSDLHSVLEVIVRNTYPIDPAFAADLVIDAGANIGLFSLQAAAIYPSATIVMCEPLPRNIEQTKKHMSINHVSAELIPVCIGGQPSIIPFYCRGANASSFDPHEPYTSVLEIEVLRLSDIIGDRQAQRILIKMDIEGMEIESLQSYIPGEHRAVVIFCELHGHKVNRPLMEQLFAEHGWSFQLGDLSGGDAVFEARSPAAMALGVLSDSKVH
ncbi:MAG: FkbM family methyltransferase [Edaphobacter sp.]